MRQKALLIQDVNTIRETNNAIFDDIFWVHLAYGTSEDGIHRLRALLGADPHYAPVVSGFKAIDQGRRIFENGIAFADDRRTADDLGLRRIFDEARDYAWNPCVLPRSPQTEQAAPNDEQPRPMATAVD
jgi:hypothetical protein